MMHDNNDPGRVAELATASNPVGDLYRAVVTELAPLGTPTGNPFAPTAHDIATALCTFVRDRAPEPSAILSALHDALARATQPPDTAEERAYREYARSEYESDDCQIRTDRFSIATDGSGAWVPARLWIRSEDVPLPPSPDEAYVVGAKVRHIEDSYDAEPGEIIAIFDGEITVRFPEDTYTYRNQADLIVIDVGESAKRTGDPR
jgi:hypothetical protein